MSIKLDGTLDKNHIVFKHANICYSKNIAGDDVENIFNENLMNIFLEQFEENIGKVNYNDIVYISVISNKDNVIRNLPNNLSGLFVMSSTCTNLIGSIQIGHSLTLLIFILFISNYYY